MFEIGKIIVHRDHGLCRITGVEHVSYVDKDYFVLYPKDNDTTKIMVPCDTAEAICREVISKDECIKVIESIKSLDNTFINDNKRRKEEYTKLLHSENLLDIAYLMKMLVNLFEDKKSQNKMIGSIDSNLFNEAKNKLYSEVGFVLGLDSFDDVESYILERIG